MLGLSLQDDPKFFSRNIREEGRNSKYISCISNGCVISKAVTAPTG
jgi:hypothetical protein